jgi:hypothetical protein
MSKTTPAAMMQVAWDSAGDQVQDRFFAVNHQRVAGVGAALVSDDHVGFAREDVDDFAFAFVAPLTSDHDDAWHVSPRLGRFKNKP